MFTVCPRCALSLSVTAADLRVGQGYVRCGRCASVFNALATLSDDPPAPATDLERTWEPDEIRGEDGAPGSSAASIERPELLEESLEFTLGSEEVGRIFVEAPQDDSDLGTGTFESIVLEGDSDPDTDSGATESEQPDAHEEATVAASQLAASQLAASQPTAPAEPGPQPAPISAAAVPPLEPSVAEPSADEAEPQPPSSALAHRLPAMGVALLALLLLAQWVHHGRNDLAAIPALHTPLATMYRALDSPLVPRWDLHAYEVRQLGAASGPESPGLLTVRASVRNRALRAQPLPVLRLKLHDRYGTVVAGRDLAPEEYLGSRMPPGGRLEAGQRADAAIAILDPGNDAVGFEIDACLPGAPGSVRCAADLVAHTP